MQWKRPSAQIFDGLTIELTESDVMADLDSGFMPSDLRDSGDTTA